MKTGVASAAALAVALAGAAGLAQVPPNSTAHQHYFGSCLGGLDYTGNANGWCFFDDFFGQAYDDRVWRVNPTGLSNGTDVQLVDTTTTAGLVGVLGFIAGTGVGNGVAFDWNNKNPLPLVGTGPSTTRLAWEMIFKFDHTASGDRLFTVGADCDTGLAQLSWDSSSGSVFKFSTQGAGTTTTTLAAGWALTDDSVDWRLVYISADQDSTVDRWILYRNGVRAVCHANGVVAGCTNTANVPSGDCEPGVVITNRTAGATRTVYLDYIGVRALSGDWSR